MHLLRLLPVAAVLVLGNLQPCAAGSNQTIAAEPPTSLEDARAIVAGFQQVMAVANKHILSHPQGNVYKLKESSTGAAVPGPTAAPLAYTPGGNGAVAAAGSRRGLGIANQTTPAALNVTSYTIPPEVVEAARMLAEAAAVSSPDTLRDEYAALVARVKVTFNTPESSTNVPLQRLKRPSGLVEYVPYDELREVVQNGSAATGPASIFWQETISQRGSAPYAPAGYKVWRNVKDYGAKGVGVTDDTAAIQRAIPDGGRCGAGCPSSMAYPATVYFPAGTYLVSSSITQYYNTEMLGNPLSLPTVKASSSFVGLGVIGSDVYTGPITKRPVKYRSRPSSP